MINEWMNEWMDEWMDGWTGLNYAERGTQTSAARQTSEAHKKSIKTCCIAFTLVPDISAAVAFSKNLEARHFLHNHLAQ